MNRKTNQKTDNRHLTAGPNDIIFKCFSWACSLVVFSYKAYSIYRFVNRIRLNSVTHIADKIFTQKHPFTIIYSHWNMSKTTKRRVNKWNIHLYKLYYMLLVDESCCFLHFARPDNKNTFVYICDLKCTQLRC